ncbi:MAG TPA: phosphatase PAP2 family protein [Gemmatimonadaceae bacterium]|nr:phosphatase PAP2 family protein [Gemmatimonadaceae bacterium]
MPLSTTLRRLALGATLASCLAPCPALAQRLGAATDSASPPQAATVPGRALLTRRDLVAAGALAAVTIALLPADRQIAEEFRDPGPQRSMLLRDGARTFNFLGDPGTVIAAVGAYGVGRLAHSDHLADLGLHTTEAVVLSGAATALIKGIAGRQRPYLDRTDSDRFGFGRGFTSGARSSFPSGHTTAAFAVASAVTEETRDWWPNAPWIVGPVLYGGAGLVGLARVYADKHWASDVVLGAGLGTLSGLSVVRYNHARPHNRVNRWLGVARAAAPTVTPGPNGLALAWRVTTR